MDLISAFKSEIFRPLATVIAPGAVASTPWALTFFAANPLVVPYAEKYEAASAFAFVLLATIVGFILENIGARIERAWDRLLSNGNQSHSSQWDAYLRLRTKDEIIGQRYLRTIVTRMKFELSFGPALLVCVVGLYALNYMRGYWTCSGLLFATLPICALIVYLLRESYCSAKTCAHARDLVIQAVSASKDGTPG